MILPVDASPLERDSEGFYPLADDDWKAADALVAELGAVPPDEPRRLTTMTNLAGGGWQRITRHTGEGISLVVSAWNQAPALMPGPRDTDEGRGFEVQAVYRPQDKDVSRRVVTYSVDVATGRGRFTTGRWATPYTQHVAHGPREAWLFLQRPEVARWVGHLLIPPFDEPELAERSEPVASSQMVAWLSLCGLTDRLRLWRTRGVLTQ